MEINELNELASQLPSLSLNGVSQECLIRTSASKHYYEIFHVVKSWLNLNFPTYLINCGGGTHQQLRTCFDLLYDDLKDQNFKMIGLKLKVLHNIRTSADYYIDNYFGNGNLQTILSEKNRVIHILKILEEKYLSTKAKANIV